MLKFYFHQTPNPMKIALFLEETGLDFQLVPVDTLKGDQHTTEYRFINPNGKTPQLKMMANVYLIQMLSCFTYQRRLAS